MADNSVFALEAIPLEIALPVAFHQNKTAWGYSTTGGKFVLYWTSHESATAFPVPLTCEEVLPMVKKWLEVQNYGKMPDIDGDCSKSVKVYCDQWGHVDHFWEAFVAIEPFWAMHGK